MTRFVEAIELQNANTSSLSARHKLDALEIVAVENEDFYEDDFPGFRRVTLKSGERWLAKIDAASLAAARARAESTNLPNATGWRAVFRHKGPKGAWVELLPIIGWRSFKDGRPAEPVFALDIGPEGPVGFVDEEGNLLLRTAAVRRGQKHLRFDAWLQKFMLRYYKEFPPRNRDIESDEEIIASPLQVGDKVDHAEMTALILAHLDAQTSPAPAEGE